MSESQVITKWEHEWSVFLAVTFYLLNFIHRHFEILWYFYIVQSDLNRMKPKDVAVKYEWINRMFDVVRTYVGSC